eukprot:2939698-Karenia_brevis.AAC.1
MERVEEKIKALEAEVSGLQISFAGLRAELGKEKTEWLDKVTASFAQQQVNLEQVVMDAQKRFGVVEQEITKLYNNAEGAVIDLRQRIGELEKEGKSESTRHAGYLPHKHTVPK